MTTVQHITSRDNLLLKRIRLLVRDAGAYRKHGEAWLEGDHLLRALLARGMQPKVVLISEEKWPSPLIDVDSIATKIVVLPDALMRELSTLDTPGTMGALVGLPEQVMVQPNVPTVVLDRLQDAGNVGSVLRSAAAMGFSQVVALKGTAALWSAKVLRAGMGAHFALHLVESATLADVAALGVPLLVTSSHQGEWLHQASLPWPCAWVMGHEGQGVDDALAALASYFVRIAQPGGEESLNVAAAAAICLHASAPKP